MPSSCSRAQRQDLRRVAWQCFGHQPPPARGCEQVLQDASALAVRQLVNGESVEVQDVKGDVRRDAQGKVVPGYSP